MSEASVGSTPVDGAGPQVTACVPGASCWKGWGRVSVCTPCLVFMECESVFASKH